MNLVRVALAGLLVAVLAVTGTWVVWTVDASVRRERARAAAEPAREAVGSHEASGQRASGQRRSRADAVEVLREWDARRARAWARGDTAALARLYRSDSRTGRRDVAMLGAYERRGLAVEGLGAQVLEVDVVRRGDELLVLDVTDRVSGGTVVGPGVRRELPRDAVSRREVELRRQGTTWVVVEVVERSVAPQAG